MSSFDLEPITNTALEPIVADIDWQDAALPSCLRVAAGLGDWLVSVTEDDQVSGLVGFSAEDARNENQDPLLPPKDIAEVTARLGTTVVGWFNNDMTAKGLGSTMANTPDALQPGSIKGGQVAVRSVPLASEAELYRRPEPDTFMHRQMRLVRHGGLLAVSAAWDRVTHSAKGTLAAVDYMEKHYEGARLVFAPAPPIWQRQQHRAGITPVVSPGIVLVRGGRFAGSNPMRFVGSYPKRQQ
jgi:hypothetical protein